MSGFGVEVHRTLTGGSSDASRGTIVFVNSLATTWRMWDRVVGALPPGWEVLRYDQRDRGGAAAPFSLDDLVADLMDVLDQAGAARAHIVGVSLGGMVGLHAAATNQERVLSLTAMCCAARFVRATWVDRGIAVRRDGVAPLIPGIIDRWFTRRFQDENPDLVATFRGMLAATDESGYAFAADLLAESDVRGELPSIAAPTLVISGEEDIANPVHDLEAIARGVPDSRLEVLQGVAHLAPVAAPAAVARLIATHAGAHRS
jgi:3-oxoadipate enol-lactonase